MKIRRYSELRNIDVFEDRYEYLKLNGNVGQATFGFDRYLNQKFYRSREWRTIRSSIITRDNGCDLGIEGFEIHGQILIHHMNPISADEIIQGDYDLINPEFLITTTHNTHNAIHYGDASLLPRPPVERTPGDTQLWKAFKDFS